MFCAIFCTKLSSENCYLYGNFHYEIFPLKIIVRNLPKCVFYSDGLSRKKDNYRWPLIQLSINFSINNSKVDRKVFLIFFFIFHVFTYIHCRTLFKLQRRRKKERHNLITKLKNDCHKHCVSVLRDTCTRFDLIQTSDRLQVYNIFLLMLAINHD